MNPNFFSLSDNAIALLLEAAKVAFPEKVVTFTTATLDGYRTYLFHFFEAKKDTVILSWIELATAYLYMIKEGLPVKEEIDE
jgi:hypothetical protein